MNTLGELSASAPSWLTRTGTSSEEEWFTFPYLGTPWDHLCTDLRSKDISITVIVPFWNSAVSLGQCLTSIRLSSLNRLAPHRLEVILCDDGSSDESWEIATRSAYGMDVKAFKLSHRSQSAALNFALEHASGDVVVFCDSDMLLGCGAFDELAARHEHWSEAVCFGFRSNIRADISQLQIDLVWEFMHTEAFSGDNRVSFDLPSIEPNMLMATRWLSVLDGGRSIIDTQGSVWPRHRFVFGCLFSVRLELLRECGCFPDTLLGWGFGDTLVAARLEASGGFLLPVTSAWGHHFQHDIRHPAQWFQGNRNQLAYQYLLSRPPSNSFWRSACSPQVSDSFYTRRDTPLPPFQALSQPIQHSALAFARLGWWEQCLSDVDSQSDPHLISECLYRLGRYEDAIKAELSLETIWGILSLHRCGATAQAAAALKRAGPLDPTCAYAATTSVPELRRLAESYHSIGMSNVAQNYSDFAKIIVELE